MFNEKYLVDAVVVIIVFLLCAVTWESKKIRSIFKFLIVVGLLVGATVIISARHGGQQFEGASVTSVTENGKRTLQETGAKALSLLIRLVWVLFIGAGIFMLGPVKYLRSKTKPEFLAATSLSMIAISILLMAFWSWLWFPLFIVAYFGGCWYTVPIRMRGTPTFHGKFNENVTWDVGPHMWWVPIWYLGSGMILIPYEVVNKNVATEWLQTKATPDPSRDTPHGSGAAIRVKYTLYTKIGVSMKKVLNFSEYTADAMFVKVKDLVDAWLDSELKGMDYDHALNYITNLEMPESVKMDILYITGCLIMTFKVNDRDPDPLVAEVYSKTVVMEAEQRQLELQKILSRLRGQASGEEEVARLEVIGIALQDENNVRALNALRELTLVRGEGTKWIIPADISNLAGLIRAS